MTQRHIDKLLPWLVLAAGLAATFLLQQAAFNDARRAQQDSFAFQTREITMHIEQRLAAYEQVLLGVKGLYLASKEVDRNEFFSYVINLNLGKHYPGIQGIGFALIIPPEEKARHVEAIRKEGFPGYRLHPEGKRDLYTSVIFLEPFISRNLRAFGYDMYSEKVRRAAMEHARDHDKPVLSGKVTLIQETGPKIQPGFLMYIPVYRNGAPHGTLAERRANVIGWVYAAFRMNDLMHGILGEQVNRVNLEIFDGENTSLGALMYGNDESVLSPNSASLYQATQRLEILGHSWTIRLSSLPFFESNLDTGRVSVIRLAGISMSLLLSLLVWQLLRGRGQALDMAQELRIAAVAFESQESLMITDANNVILRVNQAFTRITGYTAEEAVGQTPRLLKSGRHNADFYQAMWQTLHRTGTWHGEVWDKRKNGEVYPALLTISAIEGDDGVVTHYVGAHLDITERKAAEEKINLLAFYDPLTQLPNRRLLYDRLKLASASSARSGRKVALLFIDLDNFKNLNDTLGHDIGDLLLQQVAQRLALCVREGDTVARLGGDEFVVILDGLSEQPLEAAAQTESVGEKIITALNQPYQLAGHECHSTPSIGITLFSGHEQSADKLFKQADIAMYQSKKAGRNTLRFFDPQMQQNINTRATLEYELRKAIDKRQFRLYYQVQVNEAHQPLGAEALIRWMHPERGLLLPEQFIPLAEETGLIHPIGQWVLDAACMQLKKWQQSASTRDLVLAVNLSTKQFHQPDFAAQVQDIVQRHAINPRLLKLELTESLLLENIEGTIATMNTLKKTGIQFSLDDFGAGYSSMQYLKQLPLDQLKIDLSFVRDIATDNSDKAIVRSIIVMAKSMNLDVLAEGVELKAQQQLLLGKGCTHYQGYLFGKPVPIEQFEALLGQV